MPSLEAMGSDSNKAPITIITVKVMAMILVALMFLGRCFIQYKYSFERRDITPISFPADRLPHDTYTLL
jgi:hypothetical protein